MIKGIGIDMVEVERVERAMTNPRFLQRLYTETERNFLAQRHGGQSAAGMFAAKEAVAKALGTGFSGIRPNQIEILHLQSGKPAVRLVDWAGEGRFHLSITHTRQVAQAIAIWEVEI